MFRKLNQQKITNKKQTASPHRRRSKSTTKTTRSYSAIRKKQLNNSELFDYQIAWIHDHLYQGCFQNNKKHGEGIVILENGLVAIGNWDNGLLSGYALFITPFGGKLHVNYLEGYLEGWAILEYSNCFEIFLFKADQPDSVRRRYDQFEQLWTQSLYTSTGKFIKVLRIQKTKDFRLPSYIVDEQLLKFYDKVIMKGQTLLKTSKINTIKINDKFQYYGYVNTDQTPNGLGVIYSFNELYAGNFKSGSLDEKGMILFQNGLIYKGQIYGGKIWGDGVIYDINLDQTKTVRVCQQGIEEVLAQQEGVDLEKASFKMGKTANLPTDKGFSANINILCQQTTKYYYKSTSLYNSLDNPSISTPKNEDFTLQNMNKHQVPNTAIKQPGYFSISHHNSNNSQKQSEHKQSSSNSLSGSSKSSSLDLNLKKQSKKNNLDSLQVSSEESIPANRIPAATPSFEQISKGTRSKVLYPYLLQFQMNKCILSPTKTHIIGKIMSNVGKA